MYIHIYIYMYIYIYLHMYIYTYIGDYHHDIIIHDSMRWETTIWFLKRFLPLLGWKTHQETHITHIRYQQENIDRMEYRTRQNPWRLRSKKQKLQSRGQGRSRRSGERNSHGSYGLDMVGVINPRDGSLSHFFLEGWLDGW